jgi:hypothetical protein
MEAEKEKPSEAKAPVSTEDAEMRRACAVLRRHSTISEFESLIREKRYFAAVPCLGMISPRLDSMEIKRLVRFALDCGKEQPYRIDREAERVRKRAEYRAAAIKARK